MKEEDFVYEGQTTGFHPSSTEYAQPIPSLDSLFCLSDESIFLFAAEGGQGKHFHVKGGDILVIEKGVEPIPGRAYIFHIGENFHMGWYRIIDGRPILLPQKIYLDGEMDFEARVWGGIVAIIHLLGRPKGKT